MSRSNPSLKIFATFVAFSATSSLFPLLHCDEKFVAIFFHACLSIFSRLACCETFPRLHPIRFPISSCLTPSACFPPAAAPVAAGRIRMSKRGRLIRQIRQSPPALRFQPSRGRPRRLRVAMPSELRPALRHSMLLFPAMRGETSLAVHASTGS